MNKTAISLIVAALVLCLQMCSGPLPTDPEDSTPTETETQWVPDKNETDRDET